MMATRLAFGGREVLDAMDRAIRPLSDDASMLTTNDDILDLIIDELLPEDDAARVYGVDNWLLLLDVCTPDAYELAMTVSDCHQAGHGWRGTHDQLSKHWDAKHSPNPIESW